MTMILVHEGYDEAVRFLDAIRQLEPESILPDGDPRLPELSAIKETAQANDEALVRLYLLRPECMASYKQQWQKAEDDLDRRVARLKIEHL